MNKGVLMPDVLTISESAQRARSDGLPVSEHTLRQWIKTGAIPVRKAGQKSLIFYPNLVRFLQCADGADNTTSPVSAGSGIRRVEV